LPDFEYVAPKTVQEACFLLAKYQDKAKVIAGGTDLLVSIKKREITPQYLVNLKTIPGLDRIEYNQKGLKIGVLATHRVIAKHPIIIDEFGLLSTACNKIGTPQVRNMGTIGGNLCNAAPSADGTPPLIALSARAKLVSSKGERTVPLEEFFAGPGETILEPDELLTQIQIPKPPARSAGVYLKFSPRGAVDIAVVGVAILLTLGEDGTCSDGKIVLGAVAPTPMRAKRAEAVIKGVKIEDKVIEQAAQAASDEAHPISDVRSSAGYRQEIVRVLIKRAIIQSLEQARSASFNTG